MSADELPILEGPVLREPDPIEQAEQAEAQKPPPGVKQVSNWSIGFAYGDEFNAPETRGLAIAGTWPDGKEKVSTAIVEKIGPRIFRTDNGSYYELTGDPSPEYAAFCVSIGKPLNLADPVKFIVRKTKRDDAHGGAE